MTQFLPLLSVTARALFPCSSSVKLGLPRRQRDCWPDSSKSAGDEGAGDPEPQPERTRGTHPRRVRGEIVLHDAGRLVQQADRPRAQDAGDRGLRRPPGSQPQPPLRPDPDGIAFRSPRRVVVRQQRLPLRRATAVVQQLRGVPGVMILVCN